MNFRPWATESWASTSINKSVEVGAEALRFSPLVIRMPLARDCNTKHTVTVTYEPDVLSNPTLLIMALGAITPTSRRRAWSRSPTCPTRTRRGSCASAMWAWRSSARGSGTRSGLRCRWIEKRRFAWGVLPIRTKATSRAPAPFGDRGFDETQCQLRSPSRRQSLRRPLRQSRRLRSRSRSRRMSKYLSRWR